MPKTSPYKRNKDRKTTMKHKVHVVSSNKTKCSLDFVVSLLHKNFYSAQRSSNLINHRGDENNTVLLSFIL